MNISTNHSPPFSLPMRYIILGITMFGLFGIQLAFQSFNGSMGFVFTPNMVSLTHLLTLGVIMSIAMGAVYQLLTVTFLVPIRIVGTAKLNFWLYILGFIGLWYSMFNWWVAGLIGFGSMVTLALIVYASIVILSIHASKVYDPIRLFVLFAHVYLIVAVGFAWDMLLSISNRIWGDQFQYILGSHILFAVFGFFTMLISGFSLKLVPMFTLSHGFSVEKGKYTFWNMNTGLWVLEIGIWSPGQWLLVIGGAITIVAILNHLLHIREMYKKRMRKRVDIPIKYVLLAVPLAAVGIVFMLAAIYAQNRITMWQNCVGFYLLGWVVLSVMGYAYKIIPFLIWNKRYGTRVGKERVPLMHEMFNLKSSQPVFILFTIGLILFPITTIFDWKIGTIIGSLLLAVSIWTFVFQITKIMNWNQLYRELLEHD